MFIYMETSSKASKETGKNKKEIILEFVGSVKGAHCGWEVIGSCSTPFSKHLVMCQRHLVVMVMNSLTSLPPIRLGAGLLVGDLAPGPCLLSLLGLLEIEQEYRQHGYIDVQTRVCIMSTKCAP